MLYDSITLLEGSAINNMVVTSGTTFPSTPDSGELFFRTDTNKMFLYNGSGWSEIGEAGGGSSVVSVAGRTGVITLVGADITDLANVATSGAYADLSGSPALAAVSLSGSYNDLLNKPTIISSVTLTGDVTGSGPGSLSTTLATVNANVGTIGSSSAIPVITVDGKGRITAVTTVAPSSGDASTLTGTTLASSVVTSSLTSVGTLSSLAVNGNITTGGAAVGFKEILQNSQATAYTLVLTDSNKHIYNASASPVTFTIPANASVVFPIGAAITFINPPGGGTVTIAINSDTLILAGAGTTGSRTLAVNGMATAMKITATSWMISGANLT